MRKQRALTAFLIGFWLPLLQQASFACGFWGDGDVGMITNEFDVAPNGRLLSQIDPVVARGIADTRVPGNRGFSFALRNPTEAIPYKNAVGDADYVPITRFRDLGFVSVIDLDPHTAETEEHRRQTQATGINYYSVPIDGFPPHHQRVRRFAEIISDPGNLPVIVYAENSVDLAALWTAYRFSSGMERASAINEGRLLGLQYSEEQEMQWHLLNGKLAILRPSGENR